MQKKSNPDRPEIFDTASLDKEPAASTGHVPPRQVVKPGRGKVKKETAMEAAASSFFEATLKDVGEYLLWDVFLPAAKDGLYSLVTGGFSMMLFGEERNRGGKRKDEYTHYNSMYSERETRPASRRRSRPRGAREPIILSADPNEPPFTKAEVYDIQEMILAEFTAYDCVDLKFAYQAAGIRETDWTDVQWGWVSLRGMTPEPGPHGWQLRMPAPIRLDQ